MNETKFLQAVNLVKAGHKKEASALFQAILRVDRTNELAWIWYAECLDTREERIRALELCIKLNPQAELACQGLARLHHENVAGQAKSSNKDVRPGSASASQAAPPRPTPAFTFTEEEEKSLLAELSQAVADQPTPAPVAPASAASAPQAVKATVEQPVAAQNTATFAPAPSVLLAHLAQVQKHAEKKSEDELMLAAASSVFTVRPDDLSPEEFARIEETTADFLLNNRDVPAESRLENGWAAVQLKPNGTRPLRNKKKLL